MVPPPRSAGHLALAIGGLPCLPRQETCVLGRVWTVVLILLGSRVCGEGCGGAGGACGHPCFLWGVSDSTPLCQA